MRSQGLAIIVLNLGLGLTITSVGDVPAIAQLGSSELQAPASPANSLMPSLTLSQLQNATYQIPLLGKVALNQGVYQSQSQPTVEVKMSKRFVIGDVNQDNAIDAVTVLRVTEPGRKPTFYLAAIANQNGQPNNIDTISIGQGFGVKSLSLKGQQITVTLLKYGPRDAPCCPSDQISQSYWFNSGSGELIATSFNAQNPNPGGLPVRAIANPINAEINNNLSDAPAAVAIEF